MATSEAPKGAANEARWAEVVAAAREVFVERGYKAATVQDIASRVGLLKGSLYYYIESKEALLFEIVKRSYDQVVAFIEEDADLRGGDATTRLCRFIELFVEQLRNNSTEAEAHMIRQEIHHLLPEHRREIGRRAAIVEARLRDIIEQGIAEGAFDAETDPELAVRSIFSILNNVSWNLRRGDQPWATIVAWYQTFMVKGLGGVLSDRGADPSFALDTAQVG